MCKNKNIPYAASVARLICYYTNYKKLFYLLGSLFASVASVEVIGSITANISENTIYAATVSVINGFVFFVMAGYIFIDLIMLV